MKKILRGYNSVILDKFSGKLYIFQCIRVLWMHGDELGNKDFNNLSGFSLSRANFKFAGK